MLRRAPLLALLALAVLACSSGESSTTGKRIVLHNAVSGDPTAKAPITTGFGWDVTLTKAAVVTSGFYYFDGPPPTAMFRPRAKSGREGGPEGGHESWGERLAGLFIGTAYAHPGHYQAGTALGQVVLPAPVTVDALAAAPLVLPDGEGITGTYRSARFVIAPSGPGDALLGAHVAIAEGKASKHDGSSPQPIFFRLVADFADVSQSVENGNVDGCVLDETPVTADGSIRAEIIPKIWLNLVDFSKIAPGSEGAPTEAKDAGFAQGITQLSAYHFKYTTP